MSKSPIHAFAEARRVVAGEGFTLSRYRTDDDGGLNIGKKEGEAMLEATVDRIAEQQERLYADARRSVAAPVTNTDARREETERQKRWDDRMRRATRSMCNGC